MIRTLSSCFKSPFVELLQMKNNQLNNRQIDQQVIQNIIKYYTTPEIADFNHPEVTIEKQARLGEVRRNDQLELEFCYMISDGVRYWSPIDPSKWKD